jgi:hypothetical protein
MQEIVAWDPLVQIGRWVLLLFAIVFAVGGFVALLYMARFFRPSHAWRLITADLPAWKKVGGSAKLMGQELELNAELDSKRDEQLDLLTKRVEVLENSLAELAGLGDDPQRGG